MRSRLVVLILLLTVPALVAAPAHARRRSRVVVTTVPRISHVHFEIAGKRFQSNDRGVAQAITPSNGKYVLSIRSPALAGSKRRVQFVAWSDGSKKAKRSLSVKGTTRIAVGVDVDYIVAEQLWDARGERVDGRLVDSLTFVDEAGESKTVVAETAGVAGPTALIWQRHPAGTRWLPGTDVAFTRGALESQDVGYEISSARTPFGDVAAEAARFYPARSDTWPISLRAYTGTVDAKGLIAGAPSDVVVTVSGEGDEIGVPDGETLLLGPGDYVAKANSGGLSPGTSFSLPGPPTIGVRVIGWLDIAIVVLLAGGVAVVVLASKRRRPAQAGQPPAPIAIPQKTAPSPSADPRWSPGLSAPAPAEGSPSPPEPARAQGPSAPAQPALGNGVATPPSRDPLERPGKERVRVRLNNGRRVEGWVRAGYENKSVLIIDVANARDEHGRPSTPTPQDAFIPRHLVQDIERRDGAEPPTRDGEGDPRSTEPIL